MKSFGGTRAAYLQEQGTESHALLLLGHPCSGGRGRKLQLGEYAGTLLCMLKTSYGIGGMPAKWRLKYS